MCCADPLAQLLPLPAMVPGSATEVIAVNGWIASRQDFVEPFASLDPRHGAPRADVSVHATRMPARVRSRACCRRCLAPPWQYHRGSTGVAVPASGGGSLGGLRSRHTRSTGCAHVTPAASATAPSLLDLQVMLLETHIIKGSPQRWCACMSAWSPRAVAVRRAVGAQPGPGSAVPSRASSASETLHPAWSTPCSGLHGLESPLCAIPARAWNSKKRLRRSRVRHLCAPAAVAATGACGAPAGVQATRCRQRGAGNDGGVQATRWRWCGRARSSRRSTSSSAR